MHKQLPWRGSFLRMLIRTLRVSCVSCIKLMQKQTASACAL